jgi:ribosomal protein S18 acetylase RimI-like enzyme
VAPEHRRSGVGRALMHDAYAWAERVGVEKISLNVRASNAPAIALYRSEGFALEGREARHIRIGETYEDNLVMARFMARRAER